MINYTVKKVTDDIGERFNFNTAISAVMELVNALYAYKEKVQDKNKNKAVIKEAIDNLVVMLAPFIPHVAEELWEVMGKSGSVHDEKWPKYDTAALIKYEVEIVVQINGKIKDKMIVPTGLNRKETEEQALENKKVQAMLEGKVILKVISVSGKLVNIVVK